MQNPNALVDPADPMFGLFRLHQAHAINASGQIVGEGTIGGTTHAFLASPVPVPAARWLMAPALVLPGAVRATPTHPALLPGAGSGNRPAHG